MKKTKSFKPGDKVFAKVKGYPPWPARVEKENGKKYTVKFYGTGEIGNIKAEDLFYFLKNKVLIKSLKRKDYNEAIEEIEKAIKKDGGDGDDNPEEINESILNGSVVEKATKTPEPRRGKRKRGDSDISQEGNKKSQQTDTEESQNESQPEEKKKKNSKEDKEDVKVKDQEEASPADETEKQNDEETAKQVTDESGTEGEQKTDKKNGEEKMDTNDVEESKDDKPKEEIESKTEKDSEIVKEEKKASPKKAKEVVKAKIVPTVIAEKSLRNCILWAEHVRKDEDYYKEKDLETDLIDYENTVLPIKLPSGVYAGIKLNCLTIPDIKTEYDRAIFEESLAKKVLEEKDRILVETDKIEDDFIIPNIEMTEEKIQQELSNLDMQNKQKRVDRLKNESKLVELDSEIKLCLGLESADPVKALEYLEEMLKIKVDCLMLLKHFHVPEMIKRLRIYVGNTKEWNMSEEKLEEFKNNAEKVRDRAEEVYKSFKSLFPLSKKKQCKTFWEAFTDMVTTFREECKDLSDAEICVLCAPPKSRQTFMEQLEEKEIASAHENTKETEKENSSEVANSEKVMDVEESEQENL